MSRIRVEPRRRVATWPAVAVVVVAAALLAVVALRPSSSADQARPGVAAASSVAATCPVPAAGDRRPDAVGVLAGSGEVGVRTSGSGSRSAGLVPGGRDVADLSTDRRTGWASARVPAEGVGAVTLSSTGALAPGAVAATAAELPRALGGGLAATACTDADTERWFVGAGAGLDRTSTVVLTNATDAEGVVDLTLRGPGGPVEAVGGAGVVVRPGTTRTVALADLAADTDGLALRVVTRRGAVDAAVLDTGPAGSGSAWVPPAAPPSRTQVVPGGVAGAGDAQVDVVNPGRDTATVEVAVLGADGRFQARGAEQVEVPAGGTARLPLPAGAVRAPWAVALRSSEPVTGALTVRTGGDVAHAAATPALDGPGVVPLALPLGADDDSAAVTTQVSNADAQRPAPVTVRAYAADGSGVGRSTVEVAPGATLALPRPGGAAVLVVDAAGSAVHVAGVVRSGSGSDAGVDVVPVSSAPGEVVAPVVTPLR